MHGVGTRQATTRAKLTEYPLPEISLLQAYKLRWKRRRYLWRCFRARHALRSVKLHQDGILAARIIAVVVLRNEMKRLDFFLDHYRCLGVDHFLIVDNGSDDGSFEVLTGEAERAGDVSLWSTQASYRGSRFGVDWAGWLLMRYGHGRWCLTVDADELLVFPGMKHHNLGALTSTLEKQGQLGFGALMLDLFPQGMLGSQTYDAGQNPIEVISWFDAESYRTSRQAPIGNLWVQGGPRERVFFADRPTHAPTLNKIPLVKWNRRFAYINSTHALLPRRLNGLYDGPSGSQPSGVLLHTKFLPEIRQKSAIELARGQHFHTPQLFDHYYEAIMDGQTLWHEGARGYQSPEQLAELGLCSEINWGARD